MEIKKFYERLIEPNLGKKMPLKSFYNWLNKTEFRRDIKKRIWANQNLGENAIFILEVMHYSDRIELGKNYFNLKKDRRTGDRFEKM